MRKYPIGIQTFERIRREGYVYVDKTDLVWQIANFTPFVFLSRPRRFGKSLLTSTLESYFRGDRHLFEGLKIMDLETEWEQYPVLHLDFSNTKGLSTAEELRAKLRCILKEYANTFGIELHDLSPETILFEIVDGVYNMTGKEVVVLIDNYDASLLDVIGDPKLTNDFQEMLNGMCTPLKSNDVKIKFCFITGISKFPQPSIFSAFNCITYASMLPKFAELCGITENELTTQLHEEVETLAKALGCSYDETLSLLKKQYGGYHFSVRSQEVYNPYSLFRAFEKKSIANYLMDDEVPEYLTSHICHLNIPIEQLEDIFAEYHDFDTSSEEMTLDLPLLYLNGFLTIKNYDFNGQMYTLSIPNQEVRDLYLRIKKL